jgi:hypothetical protein
VGVPVKRGEGKGPGRAFTPDFEQGQSGMNVVKVLDQRLSDGSDRYELVGFAVLNSGANKNVNLGDAIAFYSNAEFANRKQARLVRQSQTEQRGEQAGSQRMEQADHRGTSISSMRSRLSSCETRAGTWAIPSRRVSSPCWS